MSTCLKIRGIPHLKIKVKLLFLINIILKHYESKEREGDNKGDSVF